MRPTSAVFDLDGTLVDSSPDIAAALNAAMSQFGRRALTAPEVLAMLGGGPRVLVRQALDAVGSEPGGVPSLELDDAGFDALVADYSARYRAEPAARTEFFADAAEVLPALAARGLRLGVCTNKRTDIAELVLEHLGVRDLFGAVVGSDRASSSKPDPAHLLETLTELGADPGSCIYVGDTEIDARTAAAAGVRYAHVAWGHAGVEAPIRLRAFSELLPFVDNAVDGAVDDVIEDGDVDDPAATGSRTTPYRTTL